MVHRVQVETQDEFANPVAQLFARRHETIRFDVLEGPDYAADAYRAIQLVPDIPFVLKLHTPSILLLRLNYYEPSFFRRLSLYLGSRLRGYDASWGYPAHIEHHRKRTIRMNEMERTQALMADEIVSPSRSLGEMMLSEWTLASAKMARVPYPFTPPPELLKIPPNTNSSIVTFIGRLEARKGVVDLADAIPAILRQWPQARFRFVGASDASPKEGVSMTQFLQDRLRAVARCVEFVGPVAPDAISQVLAETDVCVFPSHWENFPYVCLEAMAAARGIVAGAAGGMADMLDNGRFGHLISAQSAAQIHDAVIDLLAHPQRRIELGKAARARLLQTYDEGNIGPLQEASYARAITRRARAGSRSASPAPTLAPF